MKTDSATRMHLRSAWSLVESRSLRLLFSVNRLFSPFYRLSFLAAASSCGVLRLLEGSPHSLQEIRTELAIDESRECGFEVWLDLGVRLGELAKDGGQYRLDGFLARKLANAEHDEVAALIQEVVCFHHRLILETPARLQQNQPWTLAEHDGALIARSSRIMEPFIFQVIDSALPKSGPLRLLEVGCGSGTYLRHAALRNPELHAMGIDIDPHVIISTRQTILDWGMQHRLEVEVGDIRNRPSEAIFDVVTLYNVIYYFPEAERIGLFAKLASFLVPGGRLIMTTSCRGGSPGMHMLDIWTSNTVGSGRLPMPDDVPELLRAAGFTEIRSKKAIPGEPYYEFTAVKPISANA